MGVQRQSKREYMARMQGRYLQASKREKGRLLDEVVEVTGYHRRHALRVLRHGRFPDPKLAAVQGLAPAGPAGGPGRAAGGPPGGRGCTRRWWWGRCGSRPRRATGCAGHAWRPSCPSWCRRWRPRGSCGSRPADRAQLLAMSARTIDRRLRPFRLQRDPRNWHGLGTTKPGTLLKDQVPMRTYTPWEDQRPGFLEIDLVAHCGTTTEGFYLNTLVGTDVATGWTECVGVWGKSQRAVFAGVEAGRGAAADAPAGPGLRQRLGVPQRPPGALLHPGGAHLHPQPPLLEERPGPRRAEELACRAQARRLRALRERGRPGAAQPGLRPAPGLDQLLAALAQARREGARRPRPARRARSTTRRRRRTGGCWPAASSTRRSERALAETFAASGPAGPAPPVGRRRRAVGAPARTSERALRAGSTTRTNAEEAG